MPGEPELPGIERIHEAIRTHFAREGIPLQLTPLQPGVIRVLSALRVGGSMKTHFKTGDDVFSVVITKTAADNYGVQIVKAEPRPIPAIEAFKQRLAKVGITYLGQLPGTGAAAASIRMLLEAKTPISTLLKSYRPESLMAAGISERQIEEAIRELERKPKH